MIKKTHHVHVYKVTEKADVTIKATNSKQAMKISLKKAKDGDLSFEKSDCTYLSMAWKTGRKK